MNSYERIPKSTNAILIQEWISSSSVGDSMLWKAAFTDQIIFFRDRLCALASVGIEDFEARRALAKVIGEHCSKSIQLPVVEYDRPDLQLRIVIRDNFHGYSMSVVSKKAPGEVTFEGLFDLSRVTSYGFEGFPKHLVFGAYNANPTAFSVNLNNSYAVWATVFLLMRAHNAF